MNERDREAVDDWVRDYPPDPDEFSLEDSEEAGSTENYFFLRYRDSATVNGLKRMARGVVRPFIWSGSLAIALSSDSTERSTGEIGDWELAVWKPGSRTADYMPFPDYGPGMLPDAVSEGKPSLFRQRKRA